MLLGKTDDGIDIMTWQRERPEVGETLSISKLVANSHDVVYGILLLRASCLVRRVAILTLPSLDKNNIHRGYKTHFCAVKKLFGGG